MKKYKVISSSRPEFTNIEMNIVFDDIYIGKNCEVLGTMFKITQTGQCIVLANEDWVLTLFELPEEKIEKWTETITDPRDLRINHEIDLFFKPKELKIIKTERIKHGLTYECLYRFLKNEWKFISHLVDTPIPFDYNEEFRLFILNDEWNLIGDTVLIKNGSFSRYNKEGRCI